VTETETPAPPPLASVKNPFAGIPCTKCHAEALRLETRLTLDGPPETDDDGTVTASAYLWPWCICDGCGATCAGRFE
jgi:ribosomal protein L40E